MAATGVRDLAAETLPARKLSFNGFCITGRTRYGYSAHCLDARTMAPGYNLGVIGQHLTHGGIHFNSIGALVSALNVDSRVNIVLNPKILTEDNSPAEIFVGINIQFPTQAIANNNGNIVTQNFEVMLVLASK